MKSINEEIRAKQLKLMEEQAALHGGDGSALCNNLSNLMHLHYLKMKSDAGLDDASQSSHGLDEETEAAF